MIVDSGAHPARMVIDIIELYREIENARETDLLFN